LTPFLFYDILRDEILFQFHAKSQILRGNQAMSESIRAVDRALDILLCFTRQTPELTMTQIAEQVGIHKSTVHRLLGTLEKKRFVERNQSTGIYRPGIRLLQVAYLSLEHNDLRRLAAPFLRILADQSLETVDLAVMDDNEIIYIDVIESPQRVKLAAAIGMRLPTYCTASGKAILAHLSEDRIKRTLAGGMPQHTERTLVTPEALFETLRLVREQGVAFSEQEYEEGINAIGAPILDINRLPIASVAVAGPAYRLTRARMLEICPILLSTVNSIAEELNINVYRI
jgi:DNA-binding IclR family transcriptional regulator